VHTFVTVAFEVVTNSTDGVSFNHGSLDTLSVAVQLSICVSTYMSGLCDIDHLTNTMMWVITEATCAGLKSCEGLLVDTVGFIRVQNSSSWASKMFMAQCTHFTTVDSVYNDRNACSTGTDQSCVRLESTNHGI